MFGFKQKREESREKIDLLNDIQSKWDEPLPFEALDVPDAQPQQTAEVEKIQEPQEIPDAEISRNEPIQNGADRTAIEELSKKIEDENKTINRKFKLITKNLNQLTLESQELIDLIKLYANTDGKFSEFIEDMHNLERQGWNFDLNIAAFYKFRVGKALADMKRQATNVEKICRKVGFTPSNIKAILKSPIEDLVKSLSERTIEIKKSKK
jgi:hypothetical protein